MAVFNTANFLLPKDNFQKWSVIACDQYTSEPEYWDKVENFVGDCASSLNLVLPEVYLSQDDTPDRIKKINKTMEEYIDEGVVNDAGNMYIYIERTLKCGKVRRGILGTVDLEEYDYSKKSQSLVRATEKTVVERIPPRVRVRKNAALELGHVMLLADDAKDGLFSEILKNKSDFSVLYDFDLMIDSGHITGYKINKKCEKIINNYIDKISDEKYFQNKYNTNKGTLALAVGDGNHSLATAKECYEQYKEAFGADAAKKSETRYAMAELVDIDDESLEFEAIHRVVFDISCDEFVRALSKKYELKKADFSDNKAFKVVCGETCESFIIQNPDFNLTVGCIESFLDEYIPQSGKKVDYIHGEDSVQKLCQNGQNTGIILNPMKKSELFSSVISDGALARKTFSMGEACDKRFYLESRKIK